MLTVSSALVRIYGALNSLGVLANPIARRAFHALYFLYKRHLEDPFAHLVERQPGLFEGGNIIDVGANIGYTAVLFAKALSPQRKVYALEPEVENFRALKEIVSRKRLGRLIEPMHAAVGDTIGTISLWHNVHHHADHRIVTSRFAGTLSGHDRVVEVPCNTIDNLVQTGVIPSPIAFVKIDVQGYELPVCRGMSKTLEANPTIVVALEYAPDSMRELGFDGLELLRFFEERSYTMHLIGRDGRLHASKPEDLSFTELGKNYTDLLFAKRSLAS